MLFNSWMVTLGPKNVKVSKIGVLKKGEKALDFVEVKIIVSFSPKQFSKSTRVVSLIIDFAHMNCEICTLFLV